MSFGRRRPRSGFSLPPPGLPPSALGATHVGAATIDSLDAGQRPASRRVAPRVPASIIAGAAMVAAAAAGFFIAEGRISLGIAIVLGSAVLPLVFLDLAVAIAIWVGLLFIEHLSVLSVAPSALAILVVVAWLGTGGVRRGRLPVLQGNRGLVVAMVLLASWLLLSAAWAPDPGASAAEAGHWWEAVVTFAVVASTLTTTRDVRIVMFAFVIGSVVSVIIGLLGIGGPHGTLHSAETGHRLVGGGGDPNFQAAGFLAAMFLAAGLMTIVQRRTRVVIAISLALTAVGFFATESRGGLIALGFATLAALLFLPRYRGRILMMALIGSVGLAAWVSTQPNALNRITDFSGGGSGRADLWTVALRIFDGHPLVGVGLDNFRVVEPHFVLQPGRISDVMELVERHAVTHNTYLQLMSETGLIGLLAFLVVALLALRTSWLAARLFDAVGQFSYANLARAVLIGSVGMLAAIFFITDGIDSRLWTLFALGPVLLVLARRDEGQAARGP